MSNTVDQIKSREKVRKLYVFVDESGQDDRSKHFIVVIVIVAKNLADVRAELLEIESTARTNSMKWHKTRHDRRICYLELAYDRKISVGSVYFGCYEKPIPYFFPMLDVLEQAIKNNAGNSKSTATIYVDGIDKEVARKLTNTLRSRGISLRLVQSRREKSEPLIRLADMWAGCIRGALLNGKESERIFKKAKKSGYLREITT